MNYKTFLETESKIHQKHIPYFLKWVDLYKQFIQKNNNLELFKSNSIETFLTEIADKYEDWQIKQMKESILLYKYYYDNHKNETQNNSNSKLKKLTDTSEYRSIKKQMVNIIRLQHKSYQTEKTYMSWIGKFSAFINYKDLSKIDEQDVQRYLSYLSVERDVSVSTQKQALNAIVYFFRFLLKKKVNGLNEIVKSKKSKRLPLVLSKDEVFTIIDKLQNPYKLMCQIIYSAGLRLTECLNLRIKDIDFDRNCITIRSGKGDKDRKTILAESIKEKIKTHIETVKDIYEKDKAEKINGVELPHALERKYPNASKEWGWFWVFPSHKLSIDPRSKIVRRHYLYPTSLQKAFKKALRQTEIVKNASIHTLRHSFATHLIESNYDIRTVQELLGHSDVNTTMIYTHVAQKNMLGVKSPLDIE